MSSRQIIGVAVIFGVGVVSLPLLMGGCSQERELVRYESKDEAMIRHCYSGTCLDVWKVDVDGQKIICISSPAGGVSCRWPELPSDKK